MKGKIYNTFKGRFIADMYKPPRKGQPLYKGQIAHPQCVLSSEVCEVGLRPTSTRACSKRAHKIKCDLLTLF